MAASVINRLSIVICTYSPEKEVFSRSLAAISNLKIPEGIILEGFLVDNNSPSPVGDIPYVQKILKQTPWLSILQEPKPGLTNARLAGYRKTNSEWIIYFDDDNEPDPDYLLGVMQVVVKYPQVGVWGPGIIEVEYLGPVSNWFLDHKNIYQERRFLNDEFDVVKEGRMFYPPGTGMVVRKDILANYEEKVRLGKLGSKDRTGKSLDSAGDFQILHTGILLGYAVGSSPLLKMNHLTSARKATMPYVKRLTFGTSASNITALKELYPEDFIHLKPPTGDYIFKKIYYHGKKYYFGKDRINELLAFVQYIGETRGCYSVLNKKEPLIFRWLIRYLKLE
jgi:glycosyltransferase involved in cell wall biosynthesis